jgi:hypothetical protein
MLKRASYAVGSIILAFALFCGWWYIASDNDYSGLAGTYTYSQQGTSCALTLRADRTFRQDLRHDGQVDSVEGTWQIFGLSSVSFSQEFLMLPGQKPDEEGTAIGHFDRTLGLFPLLNLNVNPPGPTLHRQFFR